MSNWEKHELKMLEQAKRRMEETIKTDPSVLKIKYPKNYKSLIKPGGDYAKQLADIAKLEVKTATPYGGSVVKEWEVKEALPIIRAELRGQRKNEELKTKDPERWEELQERGLLRRKTLGMLVYYKGKDYTVKSFSRSGHEEEERRERQAAENLKNSVGGAINNISETLWEDVRKAIDRKRRDGTFGKSITGSEVEAGVIKALYSSTQENFATLLADLLKLLDIPTKTPTGKERRWKGWDGNLYTIEEIGVMMDYM